MGQRLQVLQALSLEPLFDSFLLADAVQRSHLRDLLRSHSPPSDSVASHLRLVIASSPADIARYDEDIDRVQAVVDELNKIISERITSRDALQAYSDECRSVFSPVRRVPVEILTAIFLWCAPDGPRFLRIRIQHLTPHAPLGRAAYLRRLSQVCGNWYATVTATPSLWTVIYLDTLYPAYLRHVQWNYRTPVAVLGALRQPAVDYPSQHSARWQAADLYIRESAFEPLCMVKGNLPLLERLEIGGSALERLEIFETAPKLTHIVFSKFGAPPRLPWTQFLEVTYTNEYYPLSAGDGLAVMSHCSNQCRFIIEDLDLSRLNVPLSGFAPVHSNVLHFALSLARIKNFNHSHQVLGGILATLSLPCMRSLSLQSSEAGFPLYWPREQFSGFASLITEDDLVACLEEMSALTTLLIADVPSLDQSGASHIIVTDKLLQRLSWTPRPPHASRRG
ncbi:hypothetical protein B0H14DRAFT_3505470 [Mycena olivaceomarginata]|nr:hypothetical protein B0H14DRAFT_3505470 [Mycena olivaceomarginata]